MPCLSCKGLLLRLVRRRFLASDTKLHTPLDRCLSLWHLILSGISYMIGAGLYVLTGTLIRDHAGPATCISFLLASISAVFTAMCYAEFSTLVPRSGSSYSYTYLMLGELTAFMIGWTMISDLLFSIAAISKALSGTINWMTSGAIATWQNQTLPHLAKSTMLAPTPDLVAAGFLLILFIITASGTHRSMTFGAVVSVIQLIALTVMAIACFVIGSVKNWTDFGGFMPFGLAGVLNGSGIAVFAFSGFEAVSNASEEAKNPRRDLPIAMFVSLAVVTFIYLFSSLGLSFLVPKDMIDYSSPFPAGFELAGQTGMMWFAAVATLLATGATKVVSMFVIPRMFYSMASDGLIFKCLSLLEPRTRVPLLGLVVGTLISILLALFFNVETLADFTSIGILFCYFIIGVDLLVLRYIFVDKQHLLTASSGPGSYGSELELDLHKSEKAKLLDDSTSRLGLLPIRTFAKPLVQLLPSLETNFGFKFILTAFSLALLIFSIGLNYALKHFVVWSYCLTAIFGAIMLVAFLLLCIYKPKVYPNCYEVCRELLSLLPF
ncbi:unnamed protein product [Protopolystoma xenopodis]|uniref:Cationic amino acid transporter C-terminal domain-containing protein n=1 Tax=Protopolystoma xenopodis TaxID=117903 RepID=A0A3S5AZN6_9PLAT|nr:unnamed protein product [Protopolystoma xenopodis]